ncbi:MAG: hypothetical protein SGI71_09690 [Verrucomicrobiota bacterium]|nr:hypothetical protein [Verrucomicrobiota bacterium]
MNFIFIEAAKSPRGGPTLPPQFRRILVFYSLFALWGVLRFFQNLMTGLFLRMRRYRTFCLVSAAISCIHLPFGTVLGIFSLMVLLRPSVKKIFDENIGT